MTNANNEGAAVSLPCLELVSDILLHHTYHWCEGTGKAWQITDILLKYKQWRHATPPSKI